MARDFAEARKAAALTQQGVELFFRGRYDEALGYLDQALALDGDAVRAICGRALCLAQLGKSAEGLAAVERAVALEAESALAYSVRAVCRHRAGDDDGARADHEQAIALAPDDYRLYYNYACFWAERGDEDRCRRLLRQSFELATVGFAEIAAEDPDLARYSAMPWFRELVADMKRRARGAG